MIRRSTIFVASTLLLVACGWGSDPGTVGDIAPLDTLTETYGCGHGFWVGNPAQTTALRFQYMGEDGRASDADLPSPTWTVEMIDGQNLYANWCDDVIEPGEPEPLVVRRLTVVAGSLTVIGDPPALFDGGELTLRAEGLTVEIPDGEAVELGDITIDNPTYGLFAG